jgi:hypothetical protein
VDGRQFVVIPDLQMPLRVPKIHHIGEASGAVSQALVPVTSQATIPAADNGNVVAAASNVVKTEHFEKATQPPLVVELSNAVTAGESLKVLEDKVTAAVEELRNLKRNGAVMETDPTALEKIAAVQVEIRKLLVLKYGPPPYRVAMKLTFPESMPDFAEAGKDGTIIVEMGPIEYVPYCVYFFLSVVDNFKGGSFHRNAGHVLQAMVNANGPGLAWQEYSPKFPHVQYTLGYAGRPGGPAFYISTVDNKENHGPASQGSPTEADGCFGKIFKGIDIVKRMQKQPGRTKPSVSDNRMLV